MRNPFLDIPILREWFSELTWNKRILIRSGSACCSNPNPQPYDSGDGNPTIRCMNCGA